MKLITSLGLVFLLGAVGACGSKSDDDDDGGEDTGGPVYGPNVAGGASGNLALSITAPNSYSATAALRLTPQEANPSSIASGAPESFEIAIKKMALHGKTTTGAEVNITIFEEDEGKAIKVNGSNIDLSELFETYECYKLDGTPVIPPEGETCKCGVQEDGTLVAPEEDGSCPVVLDEAGNPAPVQEPVGILNVAAITYDSLQVTFAPTAKIKGCVTATFKDSSLQPGEHTYCTKAALPLTDDTITPQPESFETGAAETTEIYTAKNYPPSGDLDITFPIAGGLTLEDGGKQPLTMVIDVNRMLRFYNMGRSDSGPNPGFPTDRAYFFTTLFQESLFVFAGEAGSIQGLQWLSTTCGGTPTGNDYTCADNDSFHVAGWVTLIQDPDGAPIAVNFMPDDDNALTTIKGGNNKATGLDNTLFEKKTGDIYEISYALSDDVGKILDFDIGVAKGDSFSSDYTGVSESFGNVTFTRGL